MAFEKLSREEQDIILQCMTVLLEAPYIEDPEFQTRLGLDKVELARIISVYPHIDDEDDSIASVAINNCMNEVCYGVDIPSDEWAHWFKVQKKEVEKVFKKWRQLKVTI